MVIGAAVVLGCAAYEAGNILGSVAGFLVLVKMNQRLLLIIIGLIVFLLLTYGGQNAIIKVLGTMVFLMGALFIFVALSGTHSIGQFFNGTIPNLPRGSQWVTLALIGTTIVPYNIYLGSGLSHGQSLGEMRFGLAISVVVGGVISIAILVAATQIDKVDSFLDLAKLLGDSHGPWAYWLMGLGLFAAGFTSSITAPMAAGMITSGLFEDRIKSKEISYRAGWSIVLLIGLFFGLLDVKPVPIIVAAQALNGFILPFLGIFLLVVVNDKKQMKGHVNSAYMNLVSFVVLEVLLLLGLNGLWNAMNNIINLSLENNFVKFIIIQSIAFICLLYTGYFIYRKRTV